MSVFFDEKNRIFQLDTKNTSYLIGIVDQEQFLGHIYYGKKLRGEQDAAYLLRIAEPPFVPSVNSRERSTFLDCFPMEYSGSGTGDFRESCIRIKNENGQDGVAVRYQSHEIQTGKPQLDGLPSTFDQGGDAATLILHCEDRENDLQIDLLYSVFEQEDAITRSVIVKNNGTKLLYLTKIYSACLDMDNHDYQLVTLHGGWARERQIEERSIGFGKQSVSSYRGESSHQEHPFIALKEKETTQESGNVYAMHFVYSGNFLGQAERTQFNQIRMTMGIHPEHFNWKLGPGEQFTAPEVVMTYSAHGIGQMTRNFHNLYRNHLIRSPYLHQKRPVLINNWEATYFQFNTEKLLSIAERAASLGIEMFVMDDGWFGHRNNDDSSLGDWQVNEEKITGGLHDLVEKVKALGMKFGIWFEPEMISPDSDLYRTHPEWAIALPGREAALSRAQYVLDLSREDVLDYVYECVARVLRSADISYVKWDMNRQLCDLGSCNLPTDRQGELSHRYVLGVYELQERLVREFPDLLLENCSGGGARFDPGMLYYSPQIWCSDDTDAVERLGIQEGTQLLYPLSAIGAHVSDCPNHTVGRVTPFQTRGHVALSGTFGYELDITRIPECDQNKIPGQIALYHRFQELIREGDYYRIASFRENREYDCWMVVSHDQKQALMTFVQVMNRPNSHSRIIPLKGLHEDYQYHLEIITEETEPQNAVPDQGEYKLPEIYGGDLLMQGGLLIRNPWGDYQSRLYYLHCEDLDK